MADKAEAVYLDDLGNVVPREQARRVRITLIDTNGKPVREIWGTVYHAEDTSQWSHWQMDNDALE